MPTNKYHFNKGYFTNTEFSSCTVLKRPGVLVAIIIFVALLKGFYGSGRTILGQSCLHSYLLVWKTLSKAAYSAEALSADS